MRDTMRGVGLAFLALAVILVATWALQGNDFFLYRAFATRYAKVQREVFVNTPSYVQGKQQFLTRLHFEWERADAGHREVVCALARHEAATLDPKYLPQDLQTWECTR